MNEASVLVVTPTLGTRQSLAQTILSVRLYGGSMVSHVLVGPSSTLDAYQKAYPWLTILEQPNTKGVYPALNHALKTYGNKFPYFAYINDDDCWTEGFTKLLACLLGNKTIDIVYGRVLYGSIGKPVQKGPYFPIYKWFKFLSSKGIPFITQQSIVIKMDLILRFRGFDESLPLSADSNLWSQVFSSSVKVKSFNLFCSYYEKEGSERLSFDPKYINLDANVGGQVRSFEFSPYGWFKIIVYRLFNSPLYLERFIKKIFAKLL